MPIQLKNGSLLSVSKAEKADLAEILELQYRAYQSEAQLFGTTEIPPLKQTLDDLEAEFLIALFLKVTEDTGKIVASVRGYAADGTFHIGKLIVEPSQQGQGIGSKLLEEIEHRCHCNRMELFTSSRSLKNIHLYEKLGYTIFRDEKITDTLTFVYLSKIIR